MGCQGQQAGRALVGVDRSVRDRKGMGLMQRPVEPRPKSTWIRDANDPRCTCQSGRCRFHGYPDRGSLSEDLDLESPASVKRWSSEPGWRHIKEDGEAVPRPVRTPGAGEPQGTGESEAGVRRNRNEVFGEILSDYERLRGYVASRYGDQGADPSTVAKWLADNGHGLFVEGVPEADSWRERYWG